ncbi:AAA family ATPase [Nonomuraea sp. K274]|uniref:AAA family ATPase n=1 Tax=Nonomuraea cypriaca TaxID=1187855 RepID=A0A931EWW6_9ACTN|nr:AAA family ATPase [Nonomuraea cypriaca]MBF8185630.1 AAA family ATPase [Nonomuraea cypriaca]
MKRVLITGMSGTGKSTLLADLAARGHKTVDTDYGGLTVWHPTAEEWLWDEDRIQDLLSTEDADMLFVSGTTRNQVAFYPQFDHVVLLSAPPEVIVARLAARTNNPYGKDPAELAMVLQDLEAVEPLLRRGASFEVDASAPAAEVAAAVLRLVTSDACSGPTSDACSGPTSDACSGQ